MCVCVCVCVCVYDNIGIYMYYQSAKSSMRHQVSI